MQAPEDGSVSVDIRPKASPEQVKQLVFSRYGLKINTMSSMVSYDDLNFHIFVGPLTLGDNPHIGDLHSAGYVVKVLNSADTTHRLPNLRAQIRMMDHLNGEGITCPVHVKNNAGETYSVETIVTEDKSGGMVSQQHVLRLLKYIEGDILESYIPITPQIAFCGGMFAGKIRKALEGYQDLEIERDNCSWNVMNTHWVRDYVKYVESEENRAAALQALDHWDHIRPVISKLAQVPVHNDINTTNTIVQPKPKENGDDSTPPIIVGLIDFGNSCLGVRICDLAFLITYFVTNTEDVLEVGKQAVRGYLQVMEITESEKSVLYYLIIARMVISLVYGAHNYSLHVDPYLLLTEPGWRSLRILLDQCPKTLMESWTEVLE